MEPTNKKSNGAIFGAVIVILILVLGGAYVWTSNSLNHEKSSVVEQTGTQPESTGRLNEASAIEADLNSIDADSSTPDPDVTAEINTVQ